MAAININLRSDLQHPVKVQYLDGNLFSQDEAANTIIIEVTDGGSPATLGGNVVANVIRADGGTVAVTGGTVEGNIVSVTLPAAAYAVIGAITVIVKLTGEDVTTTIAALVANVYQSSTDAVVDPGTIIPSIEDLIDAIEDAVESIPADYSSLWTSLAPAFSTSTAYVAGQYVTYNGGVYRFTTAHAAGSWNSAHVTAVNLGGEISDLKSALDEITYKNLFNKNTIVSGGHYADNGSITADAESYYSTQYIPVDSGVGYSWNTATGTLMQICTYDATQTFISRINNLPGSNSGYTFGSTVKYIRVSSYHNNFSDFVFAEDDVFQYISASDPVVVNGQKVKNLSVTEGETNFFRVSYNVLDDSACTEGKFIDGTTGNLTNNTNSEVSDTINVTSGDVIRFTDQTELYIAIYNTSNVFKGRTKVSGSTSYTAEYTGYIRFARYQSFFVDEFMVTINQQLPEFYEEYGSYVFTYQDNSGKEALKEVTEASRTGVVTKAVSKLTIQMGKLKYIVQEYNNNSIRAHLWRTNACYIDDNGTDVTLWEGSDSDGVVGIQGEDDFIGGYHGDETQTVFKIFIDGVEYAINTTFENKPFHEIVLYATSNVYHCNTSSTPDAVAFIRNKIIKFNKDGYTVENYWTAQENLSVGVAYMGMLSVQKKVGNTDTALITGYSANNDYLYMDSSNGKSDDPAMTDVLFNTKYGDIGIRIESVTPANLYRGKVQNYTTVRLKAYFAPIGVNADISQGDIIRSRATIYFND